MYIISKEIEGDFGHRVWTQNLDEEFAWTTFCKCKSLHGHRFKIIPELYNEGGIQEDGMVTDFTHLTAFKVEVDRIMDHKFLMDIKDPLLNTLFPKGRHSSYLLEKNGYAQVLIQNPNGSIEEKELYEGLTIVNFVPTAENISKWIAVKLLPKFLPKGIRVKSLTFYETPKSFARWEN